MTNKKKAAGSPAAAQAITHPESTKIARVLTEPPKLDQEGTRQRQVRHAIEDLMMAKELGIDR